MVYMPEYDHCRLSSRWKLWNASNLAQSMSERHMPWKTLLWDSVSTPKRTQGNVSPDMKVQGTADLEIWIMDKEDMSVPGETNGSLPFLCLFVLLSSQRASCYPPEVTGEFSHWVCEHTPKFLYSQLKITCRKVLFHPLNLTVKFMLTATTQLWTQFEEEIPCLLCGFIKGTGLLERFPVSLWFSSRTPNCDLLRDMSPCNLRLLSPFHGRPELQRALPCGLYKGSLWSVPPFGKEEHLKRHRDMWCTMWCPGNNTETPSRSEAVSSCLGAHDSQKTYAEAISIHFMP